MKFLRTALVLRLSLSLFLAAAARAETTSPPPPATGANVDESRVEKTYRVDAASADAADDDKHGTADAPFATVVYACQVAVRDKDRNVGAKVIVAPGTYRETVEIGPPHGGGPDTVAPLVIESAEREQAVIDGADAEGWSPSTWKVEGGNWSHSWPYRRNPPPPNATAHAARAPGAPPGASGEAYRRGDLVAIDNTLLRQVNRLEDLTPGCFWRRVAAAPLKGGKASSPETSAAAAGPGILVQPPVGVELAGSIIQVGTRERGLTIRGRRNIVIRGLLLQHAAGPTGTGDLTAGLVLDGCSNVLVEDVLSQWNDGVGLVITGRAGAAASADFALRRVHLLHNGGSGLTISDVRNLLVEDSEASFNNYRGAWAGWIDAAGPAGVKTSEVHGSTWRRLRAVGNACRGVWWAGDNSDVTMEDGAIRDNTVSGLLIENDPGPVLVRRSLVADTKSDPGVREEAAWPAGVSIGATPDVTLESNIVAGNAVTQLGLRNPDAVGPEHRAARPVLRVERHHYHHNVFFGADASQAVYSLPAPVGGEKSELAAYYKTLDAGENCFWNPAQANAFFLRGSPPKIAGSVPANGRMGVPLANWMTLTSAEAGSMWQDPLFVDPAEGDFRVREGSPAADWTLPSDEGSAAP